MSEMSELIWSHFLSLLLSRTFRPNISSSKSPCLIISALRDSARGLSSVTFRGRKWLSEGKDRPNVIISHPIHLVIDPFVMESVKCQE